MNTESSLSANSEFVSRERKNAFSKSSKVKVQSKFDIKNTVPSTEQSGRRTTEEEDKNVRTGFWEQIIEKNSSVQKHSSTGKTSEECENANANKNSIVKNVSNSEEMNMRKTDKMNDYAWKGHSKSKTQTVLDSNKSKKRNAQEISNPKKLRIIDLFDLREKKGPSSKYSKVDSNLDQQANVIKDESKSKTRKSEEPGDEIETSKNPGDGDVTKDQLRLNTEASDEEMSSQKSNVIEISSDEETEYVEQDIKTECVEQDISDVEEQEKGHFLISEKQYYTDQLENGNYSFVFIEIETILASNSRCKEITQIGGFRKNTIGNSDVGFFKAIVPKILDYYLENYKMGGDLLQTLHMQKNHGGQFEFRNQFEIPEEGRMVTQCVSEREAFEELSSYLASVENCILVSLNEENIKLLVDKFKLFGVKNGRIHMDSVKGVCTWSSYVREVGDSKEDLNQEFEDWYDDHVKNSSSSESVKKHADVVAKMVHDSVFCTAVRSDRDVFRQLVKASRPINSVLLNQISKEEYQDSEIQYLELFSSLRPDFPVTISLKKLETYNISSEDEEGDTKIRRPLICQNGEEDNELVRLARTGTLAQVEAVLAKLPIEDKVTRAAKLNYARRWRWDHEKSLDRFGATAIIAAARRGEVKMVAALLTAGADPTLTAINRDNVTEDAVTAARNEIKNAEAAVNRADKALNVSLMRSALLSLARAKSTLDLLLIANKYWSRASYAGVEYYEKRWKALAMNPNKPTNELQLKQEIEAFIKMNETKLNKLAIEDRELQQKRQNEKWMTCSFCNQKFATTERRNTQIIAKHNPNNFDQLPVHQCKRCYLWFSKPKIKKGLKHHMLTCNPNTTSNAISPEPALSAATIVTAPTESVSSDSSKDKPLNVSLKKLDTYNISSEDKEGDSRIGKPLISQNDEVDSELVRLARIGTLAQVEAELAKLPVEDKFTRAAKLNFARRWRWDHDKSLERFGGTAIIAAARRGKVNMVAALLKAGADPTLEAKTSNDVTEDAVTAARNEMKNAESAAVKESVKNHATRASLKMKSVLLRLERAKSTLDLLLIAIKYWSRASYAGVQYFEERSRAFARNPNRPTNEVQLKQEIEAFIKTNETKFNKFVIEDRELHELQQMKEDNYKRHKLFEKREKCPICVEKFGTTEERNSHIIAKHNPNNLDQLPVGQCQKCYLWFTQHNIKKKRLKYHMRKCYPRATAKVISPEPAFSAPAKVTELPVSSNSSKDKPLDSITFQETMSKTAPNIHSDGKTVETVPKGRTSSKSVPDSKVDTVNAKDQTNNGPRPYASTLPLYPSGGYALHNFPPYAPGYNPYWIGYGNFGGGFGSFHFPHQEVANGSFEQFRHSQAEPNRGRFGQFPHPPPH